MTWRKARALGRWIGLAETRWKAARAEGPLRRLTRRKWTLTEGALGICALSENRLGWMTRGWGMAALLRCRLAIGITTIGVLTILVVPKVIVAKVIVAVRFLDRMVLDVTIVVQTARTERVGSVGSALLRVISAMG